MSTYGNQPQPVYVEQSNGLAVAGLVISILGLLISGILSPIGLVLSLVALGKPVGKGIAWAGIILGLVGTCGWGLVWLIAGAAILGVIFAALGIAILARPEQIEISRDMATIAVQVEKYKETHDGVAPASLQILPIGRSTHLDPWGGEYRYVLDSKTEMGYDVISNGPDAQPETDDDIYMSRLDEYWNNAMRDLEKHIEKVERGEDPSYTEGEQDAEDTGDDAAGEEPGLDDG